MGLDQYAYSAIKAKQQHEFYETGTWDADEQEYKNPAIAKPREIAYWRKHANLQGWMENLAERKGLEFESFNGVELELTWDDLDELERAVTHTQLPHTRGFFFGDGADDYYREHDLEFIRNARAELFLGLKVFYNSSW